MHALTSTTQTAELRIPGEPHPYRCNHVYKYNTTSGEGIVRRVCTEIVYGH